MRMRGGELVGQLKAIQLYSQHRLQDYSVMETAEKKVLLTIRGKQTDREGNIQESLSVYEAVCRRPIQKSLFEYKAVCRGPEGETEKEESAGREAGRKQGERERNRKKGESREFFYQEQGQAARLYVSRQVVIMERGGTGGTRMVFDPAVPVTKCLYRTPYGTIPMEIRTRRIAVLFGSSNNKRTSDACGGLKARVAYLLTMDGDIQLECEVTIQTGAAT